MKKHEFVGAVAKSAGVTQKVVEDVLLAVSETIISDVRDNGDQITLPGVGTFKQKVNAAREGINPLSKEKIKIKRSVTLGFKSLPSIKVVG